MRRSLVGIVVAGLAVAACDTPTGTLFEQAQFKALLESPALTVGAERDSAFGADLWSYRWNSGFSSPGSRVARSTGQWVALFDTLQRDRSPQHAAPAVDFTHEMVTMVLYGGAGTGGHSVRIRHATLARDTVFLLAERVRPGTNCVVTHAVTEPMDARVLPLRPEPVRVLFAHFVHDCEAGRDRPAW